MRAKIAIAAILLTIFASTTIAYANGPSINLPTEQVTMQVIYPDPISYYAVILSNVPPGYHVSNGQYVGWCVDEQHYIYTGRSYNATMYSSYDPACPHQCVQWDKINYILNHKQGTPYDVQAAIWYFEDGGPVPSSSAGQAIVDDANTNGEDFIPMNGQLMAVVLWIDSRTQVAIIEIVVPLENVVPEYPFGPILGIATFIGALVVFRYRHAMPKKAFF